LTSYEAVLGLARLGNITNARARAILDRLLGELPVEIVPITDELADGALAAFARYGKGRHPAALNLGDCFAYEVEKERRCRLLYVGADFSRTDIKSVL